MATAVLAAKANLPEANFMQSAISAIKWGESSDTCVIGTMMKVATYVLAFLVAIALTITLVGIPLVMYGVSEYSRQTAEQAIDNADFSGIVDAQVQGLRAQLADMVTNVAHQAALAAMQGERDVANRELGATREDLRALRTKIEQAGRAGVDFEKMALAGASLPPTPQKVDNKEQDV